MQNLPSKLVLCFSVLFLIGACESKNEEELFQPTPIEECDAEDVSYSTVVQAIFTESCAYSGCHTGSSVQFSSGIDLSSYEKTEETTPSQLLLDAIKHTSGTSQMPRGAEKLSACKISQIEAWINEGRKNN